MLYIKYLHAFNYIVQHNVCVNKYNGYFVMLYYINQYITYNRNNLTALYLVDSF